MNACGLQFQAYAIIIMLVLLIMELRFDAMLYSNLGNENSDAGHIKCSRGPQGPHHGRRQRGGQWCPAPHLICAPPFHVWPLELPRSCRIAMRSCK